MNANHLSIRLAVAFSLLSSTLSIGGSGLAPPPLFREVAADVGLRFTHVNGATGQFFMPEIMGAGGALLDYDNDGDLDVFLVQGGSLDPRTPTAAAHGHRLFRNDLMASSAPNRNGRAPLRFTDVTNEAGVTSAGYGMGIATGDYDNDGDVDLYVTGFGPDVLYRNNGDGTFSDVTRRVAPGLDDPRWNTSAAFLDYDRDGDLDLFVAAYIDFTIAGNKTCTDSTGARTYCTPTAFRPLAPRLFRNERTGTFSDVTEAAGITKAFGNGLGVACADYDGDGWIDIYVANDATPNQLWINQRDGTFEDRGVLSGAAYNAEGLPEGSMGIAAADFDNDGDEDLYVTNLPKETNTLYVNNGKGDFEDQTVPARLAMPSMPFTGFGTDWFDYDHDGFLDLFVANGAVTNLEAQRGDPFPFRERKQLYRNLGSGRFEEIPPERVGPAFSTEEVSRGAAFGDIDNDGDIDILVTNNGGPARLLINDAADARPWLQVHLEGASENRQGLGSRVALVRGDKPGPWRRARTDGSYLSASDSRVHFALPERPIDGVLVQWPGGAREVWRGAYSDQVLRLRQGTGKPMAR